MRYMLREVAPASASATNRCRATTRSRTIRALAPRAARRSRPLALLPVVVRPRLPQEGAPRLAAAGGAVGKDPEHSDRPVRSRSAGSSKRCSSSRAAGAGSIRRRKSRRTRKRSGRPHDAHRRDRADRRRPGHRRHRHDSRARTRRWRRSAASSSTPTRLLHGDAVKADAEAKARQKPPPEAADDHPQFEPPSAPPKAGRSFWR
jgi:hypothetical protein